MVNRVVDILRIKNEDDLFQEMEEFETVLVATLEPLRNKLAAQVMSDEVSQLEMHMTYVESWRDRVAQYLSFASTFVEHGKSTSFLLPAGKNVTVADRDAYQKKMTAGFVGLRDDLEQMVKSIDSRVNLCKKLLGVESELAPSRLRV